MFKNGLIIGKFYPPHKGHRFLIETGIKNCENLYLIICEKPDEYPCGKLRLKWIQEMFPSIHTLLINDTYDPDDSKIWAEVTLGYLKFTPDVVFTSEDYGFKYCEYLKSVHVQVDKPRLTVPISGTQIRNDPLKYWDFIDPPLREFYAKRIVILGPESTGKTTLCQRLAKYYNTLWVEEVGRIVSEEKIKERSDDKIEYEWKSEEFDEIAIRQNQLENQKARLCSGVLICDTNSLATYVWHRRYMGFDRTEILDIYDDIKKPDLYLLASPDGVKFIQDGYRDGEHVRQLMFEDFKQLMEKQKSINDVDYEILDGDYENRFTKAIKMINGNF